MRIKLLCDFSHYYNHLFPLPDVKKLPVLEPYAHPPPDYQPHPVSQKEFSHTRSSIFNPTPVHFAPLKYQKEKVYGFL